MKVAIDTLYFGSDWTYTYSKEIETEEWTYFELQLRGERSWHLIGHSFRSGRWQSYEWDHGIVNVYDTYNKLKDKITTISSMHSFNGVKEFLEGYIKPLKKEIQELKIVNAI